MSAARARQRELLKPPGSLGRLEELAIWMAGVSGDPLPAVRALVVVAAADHGVAEERVSAYPQEVTGQMLEAFLAGGSAVSVLARDAAIELIVVDAGVARVDRAVRERVRSTGLLPSANLTRGAALDEASVLLAVDAGRRIAAEAASRGINVLVGGDMGIANTTPSTCLAAWLTGRRGSELCGRGTGLDDAGLQRKAQAVQRALALHGPHVASPLDALRRMGGGELAVLCGLALGAAEQGLGFVCDGLITTAAAAVSAAIAPGMDSWLLAGHRSPEPAHSALLAHLGLEPIVDLGMRLGEASGACAALAILRQACALHRGMATFAEANVSDV